MNLDKLNFNFSYESQIPPLCIASKKSLELFSWLIDSSSFLILSFVSTGFLGIAGNRSLEKIDFALALANATMSINRNNHFLAIPTTKFIFHNLPFGIAKILIFQLGLVFIVIEMQLYLVDCQFTDSENQVAAYKQFVEFWESGEMAKQDKFDGFEMLFRVHAPGEGRVVILCNANGDKELFLHFAPWRTQFGIDMEITPVISCQNVVDYHKDLFAKMS